ncbi:uncharacterized protein LOC120770798 [Bactrocera tryoni]|uniref:uncharacterized protein LOC120770798 n=1 Tax=Bactrocera tryoni TaxID=59916 RepID=UPI001A971B3F|nr:uncharacterized protein LOC120770798 [Bactrocera tryoni]
MISYPEYHYDGDCGVAKFFMRLSGWAFNAFELAEIPQGYVENGDFGPRVVKYDWFELLAKFPLLIVLLVIAGLTTLFWLFWLCCTVRGLQKSTKKRHRCCLYFTSFMLLLLLLPLAIGLYLTFRTNFLLRRTKNDSKIFRDTARSALDDEHANYMNQAEYEVNPTQFSIEVNKVITDGLADWQQTIARTEQKNFEKLKYLNNNGDFYSTALQSLRDYAYELVILGIEMDDLLRTVVREAFIFLQANVKNTSLKESKMLQRERINVWHLNSVYTQYLYSYEYLEYLLKAYENISLLQKSIAKSTPNAYVNENGLFKTPTLRQLPKPYIDDRSSTEHPQILNPILYLAMAMFFVTAALAYILLMALGFGICRYYARANCMLKIFLFLNILTIPVLALLTVLHFLPAMVLHTGICHEDELRDLREISYRIPEPWRCDPVNNINADKAYDYENAELSTTQQMRENILPKIERMLPKIKKNHDNSTNSHQVVVEFPQEKWYESDIQGLITNDDYTSYAGYIKEYNKENTTGVDIFSCKLNSIPKAARTDLYDKTFVPVATELNEVLTKLKQHAQPKSDENFTKLLESAQSELVVFEKFYALSKVNLLATLSEKLDKNLRMYTKTLQSVPCYRGQRSAMNESSKCGCLEDLLMLYAIGSALLVFTLFFIMLLILLLYKLYKRGPPIFACTQPPKPDGCLRAPVAVSGSPCEQTAGTAAQSTIDGRECAVPQTSMNCGGAHAGTPLINTVNFIPPVMGAFGCQQNPPMIYPTNCQQSSPQMCAGTSQRNPPQMCATSCQRSTTQMCSSSRRDSVILPLPCRSRTQTNCVGAEAQLVGGGTTKDKTVTVMVFQGPKDRQPLVTYPPPQTLEKK